MKSATYAGHEATVSESSLAVAKELFDETRVDIAGRLHALRVQVLKEVENGVAFEFTAYREGVQTVAETKRQLRRWMSEL